MENNYQENNTAVIIGRVKETPVFSHQVYGEGFYRMEIEADRLSENADLLPVTFSDRLINKDTITPGLLVCVRGQLRRYNNYTGKKSRLVLTVFARDSEIEEETEENPNQIVLNGFICKKPVYRKTPFGREIADILLAVNRAYNKSDYIPCIAWGRNARFAGTLEVGTNVRITGRIQSRKYQKHIGDTVEERVAYEVSASKIESSDSLDVDPHTA